jgi:hypothetical protein
MEKPGRKNNGKSPALASEEYAAKAYRTYTKTTAWEDHHLEYYNEFKKWAKEDLKVRLHKESDAKINSIFANIKVLEAKDPAKADIERVKLYLVLARIWIEATPTLTPSQREEFKLGATTASSLKDAEELENRLLTAHVKTGPFVHPSVPGEKHYNYFADKLISSRNEYATDQKIVLWMIHDILYKSWLLQVESDDYTFPPPPMAPWSIPSKGARQEDYQI